MSQRVNPHLFTLLSILFVKQNWAVAIDWHTFLDHTVMWAHNILKEHSLNQWVLNSSLSPLWIKKIPNLNHISHAVTFYIEFSVLSDYDKVKASARDFHSDNFKVIPHSPVTEGNVGSVHSCKPWIHLYISYVLYVLYAAAFPAASVLPNVFFSDPSWLFQQLLCWRMRLFLATCHRFSSNFSAAKQVCL